jgi:predicted glycosyltransferase
LPDDCADGQSPADAVLTAGGATPRQKRALFFVFDGGTGLGHLRRLSHIARVLQGQFACLIVTGHRAAADWFVPPECEYIHVPAWDSLLADKAAYWGRQPFLTDGPDAALALRQGLMHGIVDAFQPDVLFVDHLPLGMCGELEDIIDHVPCRKYLVTRGLQNETENLPELLLAGKALQSIRDRYDRVLVAIDPQVFDTQGRYPALEAVADKCCSVGYVAEPADPDAIARRREARGLRPGELWTVASAGGGQHGEALIAASCELARMHPDIAFDVVMGSRTNLSPERLAEHASAATNLRLHHQVSDMAALHAAADIVISSGGYNSLLESLQGRARIVCVPSRKSELDEQYLHAAHLRRFAAIEVDIDVTGLPAMFAKTVTELRTDPRPDGRRGLDFAGANNIRRIVLADMGMEVPVSAGTSREHRRFPGDAAIANAGKY